MANVTIPTFDFSGFHYAQILEALIQWKRRDVPELTDESPEEPFIQLLRAFALVGHLNNVLLDVVANESTLPTAKLTETVRNMLRLIGYEMASASPAQADLIYELSQLIEAETEVIPLRAKTSTATVADETSIPFETLSSLSISDTNDFTAVLQEDYTDEDASVFTDYTTEANDTGGSPFTALPATPAVGDAVYFGHKDVMWDTLEVEVDTAAVGVIGVWEYYDGNARQASPDSVTDLANGTLRIELNGLLGSSDQSKTRIRVQLNSTTAFEFVESEFDGTNYIITTLLGQTTVSEDAEDYTVGSEWRKLTVGTDEIQNFTNSGELVYSLPQTLTNDWNTTSVVYSDVPEKEITEAYYIRYRVTEVIGSPTPPILNWATNFNGKQYVKIQATQGIFSDEVLGSSDGSPNQEFTTINQNFIDGSATVSVDDVEWTRVDNFLSSLETDKHYTVTLGENDAGVIRFGDGEAGAVPAVGNNNITIEYRHSAHNDGNVGANTIVNNDSGLRYANRVFNPRPAAGWQEAEGASEESLERAKIEGPASLRVRDVALGPGDVETITRTFTSSSGTRPFARSKAIEEGFGPKTVENVVVAAGGGLATSDQLAELDKYFNGDPTTSPPEPKHIVANQEVTSVNYTPKPLTITATVSVEGNDLTKEQIENQLLLVFQPTRLKSNGVDYEWEFGENVPRNRIIHEIFSVSDSVLDVALSSPGSTVELQTRELPTLSIGNINITVVET